MLPTPTLQTGGLTRRAQPRHRLARAQAVIVAAAFSLLLAGSNAVNPLLPLYREHLGFGPLLLSLTFVSYVAVLIVVLLLFSRPGLIRWAPVTMCGGLVVAAVSDLLLANGTEASILVGRAVGGVAGGFGTGAAAALVVAAVGSAGRALTATGNLVGAVIGTALSQLGVELMAGDAMTRVPEFHAIACLVAAVALVSVLALRRSQNRSQLIGPADRARLSPTEVRRGVPVFAVGCVAWLAVGGSTVLVPSYMGDIGLGLARSVSAIVFFAASAAGQLGSVWLSTRLPWARGSEALVVGVALQLLGSAVGSETVVLVGFALVGLGAGVAYRLALVHASLGLTPAGQGSMSSVYAAVTYTATATGTLVVGVLGNIWGLRTAVPVFLVVVALGGIATFRWAVRFRDVTPASPTSAP
ncbi:MFS transporter [Streptomyces sp. NPDC002156]